MAPLQPPDLNFEHPNSLVRRNASFDGHWRDDATPEGYILESWSEGLMVGALMIMACITVANMRKGVILHKLILFEVGRTLRLCLCITALINLAPSCHLAWHILLHGLPRLWVVSFVYRSITVLLLGRP